MNERLLSLFAKDGIPKWSGLETEKRLFLINCKTVLFHPVLLYSLFFCEDYDAQLGGPAPPLSDMTDGGTLRK